jgi:multidrug efflux pump subunit AcrA (membrane-fusion protein)
MGRKFILVIVLVAGVSGLGWAIFNRFQEQGVPKPRVGDARAAPVEVSHIEYGPMQGRRTFSGTLESPAAFVVRPKISGRIVRLGAELADTVKRGQVVAWLDDDETVQLVAQAEAELVVAQASLAEANSALVIAS